MTQASQHAQQQPSFADSDNPAHLGRLLAEVQRQQRVYLEAGEQAAAVAAAAGKRQRLDDGSATGGGGGGRNGDVVGEAAFGFTAVPQQQSAPHLVSLPLGLSLPYLPLTNGTGTSAQSGSSGLPAATAAQLPPAGQHGMLQHAAVLMHQGGGGSRTDLAAAAVAQQQQQLQQYQQQRGMGGGDGSRSNLLALHQQQQYHHQQQQQHGMGGSGGGGGSRSNLLSLHQHHQQQHGLGGGGSHSHDPGTDSGDDGSGGEAGGHPPHGRRSSEERLNANKEKNRRAQQRFRLRQKEKMHWLEGELQRLRALCTANNVDPSPEAMHLAAAAAPRPAAACSGGMVAAAAAAAEAAAGTAAAEAAAAAQQQVAGPSTEQMYEELELILDRCDGIPANTGILYLMAFQKSDPETKRCQYRSLRRRYEAGKPGEVAACITLWLGGGGNGGGSSSGVHGGSGGGPVSQPVTAEPA